MSEFSNYLQSPSWWVSVVIVGIAINVVSAFVIYFLKQANISTIGFLKRFAKRSIEEENKWIAIAKENESLKNELFIRAIYLLILGIVNITPAILLLSILNNIDSTSIKFYVYMIAILVCFASSTRFIFKSMNMYNRGLNSSKLKKD